MRGCVVRGYVYTSYLFREMLKEDRTAIAVDEPQVKAQIQQEEEKISVMQVSGLSSPRSIVSTT